jgi:TM2 domain-containing membrane protein YozV
MSEGPHEPDGPDGPRRDEPFAHGPGGGGTPPPPQSPPPPPPYAGAPGQPQPGAYQPGAYPQQGGAYGANPYAPYGVHPVTGVPYSDKTKLIAGLLQILLPFGIGRFYLGDTRTGIWQLVVTLATCGVGSLWSFIDGIIILATDDVTDAEGRPLRMT